MNIKGRNYTITLHTLKRFIERIFDIPLGEDFEWKVERFIRDIIKKGKKKTTHDNGFIYIYEGFSVAVDKNGLIKTIMNEHRGNIAKI